MGSIYKRGRIYWISYYRAGKQYFESARTTRKGAAIDVLKLREGDIARGVAVTPAIGRLTFSEAAGDLLTEYRVNGRRSLDELERRLRKHLTPFFGDRRLTQVTTSDVRAFVAKRQADTIVIRKARHVRDDEGWREVPEARKPVSNAEINRELTTLKRVFSLAIQAGKLIHRPHIPLLREDNVRRGFFEHEQVAAVCSRLPAPLRPVIAFAHLTGWRLTSEILPLQWRQVDFTAGEVRLDAGTTKNREGRVFPFTAELRTLLEAQWQEHDALRARGRIVPCVFHRNGEPIKALHKAWKTATTGAGCPGRIPHDLRRTAVRNLVRAGIPERVAMQMTGHKTRSVFERYNIVSPGDLQDAARRLDIVSNDRTMTLGRAASPGGGSTERIS